MPCTTILAGRLATCDGSTFMARNEDSPAGEFTPKKFVFVSPSDQPRSYRSVISGAELDLPEDPLSYTAVPNALANEGIWGEAGINAAHVAMTETETITSNPRVLGADSLVKGGIGEEDFLTIVLPYIRSAREGVLRLGRLLEEYGTYEMNGIGFQDREEVWWMETIGGHHWIARRVPDDAYAVIPNQQGIDCFDFSDAFGARKDHMCSADMIAFIENNHLDLTMGRKGSLEEERAFDVRASLGSHADSDHTYNTPRAWFMLRHLSPSAAAWDLEKGPWGPGSDTLPWCLKPDHKLTPEEVKYVLSSHYQGTPYDPYGRTGSPEEKGLFRPIGINRNNFASLTQIRPYGRPETGPVQWIAMGSNVFNAFVPFYARVTGTPAYLAGTGEAVSTDSFYWTNRLIAALADPHMDVCRIHLERYQNRVHERAHALLAASDQEAEGLPEEGLRAFLTGANERMADMVREETGALLSRILYEASCRMRNGFARSDG